MHYKRFILLLLCAGALSVWAADGQLPIRTGARPVTTNGVPHVQLGIKAIASINAELLRRVDAINGVRVQDTVISLPGAKGFWLDEDMALAREDAIVGGREFAHVHPDGSLHASLPPMLAYEAVEKGWAIPHPWSDRRAGWEGFVMIYTPNSQQQLDVVYQLVLASYNFITGQALKN